MEDLYYSIGAGWEIKVGVFLSVRKKSVSCL